MEVQTTEGIILLRGSSSLSMMGYFPEPKLFVPKEQYTRKGPQRTDRIFEQLTEAYSLETEREKVVPKRYKDLYRETIREWWIGHVLKVYWAEGYFEAHLKDLKGVESIAEFNIETVFEDYLDIERYLFGGAEFAFFVVTRHGRGNPETVSRVEFTTPHIWREEDNKKVKELYGELFPEDPPLTD